MWQSENGSIVCFFIVSTAHLTFWEKVRLVIILHTFRAPVGEPFGLFCILLGCFFEVSFFTTFEGNRISASSTVPEGVGSLKQLSQYPASGKGPTQNRLLGPTDPRDL